MRTLTNTAPDSRAIAYAAAGDTNDEEDDDMTKTAPEQAAVARWWSARE